MNPTSELCDCTCYAEAAVSLSYVLILKCYMKVFKFCYIESCDW